ncbi:SAM-dependent methyltransferase [archaeon SCG-AAA382B04]|nr:SAM-dependent methyltransferase [archaeon SCG-AAA382B04]
MNKYKDHAERFNEIASGYDEDKSEEYKKALINAIKEANPSKNDIVADIGTGTGALALELAKKAKKVKGRDISEGMLQEAREKSKKKGIKNVEFKRGSFLEPNIEKADIVVTNFAMHHLTDKDKKRAMKKISNINPQKIVIGDLMFFEDIDKEEPFYDAEVDNPARVSYLIKSLIDAGYVIIDLIKIHPEVGVIVAKRLG